MREFLLKLLEEKKEKRNGLIEKGNLCNDADELSAINEQLEELNNEIDEITNKLNSRDSEFNPIKTYTQGSSGQQDPNKNLRQIASYSTKGNQNNNKYNSDSIELREGETFSDRVIRTEESDNLDLGRYIRGVVTGDWKGAEAEKRAMSTSTLGTIIPEVLSAQILDFALDNSIFLQSDVVKVLMPEGNLTVAKVKKAGSPEFIKLTNEQENTIKKPYEVDFFKKELELGKEIDLEIKPVKLKAKTCYSYCYVSLETLHSSRNLSNILVSTFGKVLSNAIDKAFLYGQYNSTESKYEDFAPEGILNDPDIQSITTKSPTWDDYIKSVSKIKKVNGLPTHYAISSDTEETLNLLKTTDGQYLEKPKSLDFMGQIVSNQLNGNTSLVFDRKALLIGLQKTLTIRIFDQTDYCIKNGAIGFQIYSMLDCKAINPENICKITVEETS